MKLMKASRLHSNSVSLVSGGNASNIKDAIFLSSLRKVALQISDGVRVEEFYTDNEAWVNLRASSRLQKEFATLGFDPLAVTKPHLQPQWCKAELLGRQEILAKEASSLAVIMNSHGNNQGLVLRTGSNTEIVTPTELFEAVKMAQTALVVVDSCHGKIWLDKVLSYPNISLICTNGRAYGWAKKNLPDVILGSILIDIFLECGPINESFADRLHATYAKVDWTPLKDYTKLHTISNHDHKVALQVIGDVSNFSWLLKPRTKIVSVSDNLRRGRGLQPIITDCLACSLEEILGFPLSELPFAWDGTQCQALVETLSLRILQSGINIPADVADQLAYWCTLNNLEDRLLAQLGQY